MTAQAAPANPAGRPQEVTATSTTPHPHHARRRVAFALAAALGLTASLAACGNSGKHHADAATSTTATTSTTAGTTSATTATSTTTVAAGTSTTVLGPSGPPGDYPAAQPTPPSLAGAYPTGTTVDLVTVLKTLTTYEDWVWSHPNPSLVANYELATGNVYAGEIKTLTEFQQKGLHAAPTPAEIDFAKVTQPAKPQPPQANGKPRQINGYQWFVGGIVTAVYNMKSIPMFDADGQASGQAFNPSHAGPAAEVISLVQGSDGQFRIEDSTPINPPGGIAGLEIGQ